MDEEHAIQRQRVEVEGMLAVRRRSLTRSSSILDKNCERKYFKNNDSTRDEQKKSLKPAVFWSNTEKEAFRKNLIIEKKLNSELDDIRLHRAHSSRVFNCDTVRFRKHAASFPRFSSLRVGGWEVSGTAATIARRNSFSGRTGTTRWSTLEANGTSNYSNMDSQVNRQFRGATLSHIFAPQPSEDFPILRTPLQRRLSESHCHRNTSVRPRRQSLNVAEIDKKSEYIRIPTGKTTSTYTSESNNSEKNISVNHDEPENNQLSINELKEVRRVEITEDKASQTESSPHPVRSKVVSTVKKTVRWGDPEVMVHRSTMSASHQAPVRPILNLKAALSCERLQYQSSQAKVALYMKQLASCGFSSEKRFLNAETSD